MVKQWKPGAGLLPVDKKGNTNLHWKDEFCILCKFMTLIRKN